MLRLLAVAGLLMTVSGCATPAGPSPAEREAAEAANASAQREAQFAEDLEVSFKQKSTAQVFTPESASCTATGLVRAFGVPDPVLVNDAQLMTDLRDFKFYLFADQPNYSSERAFEIVDNCGVGLRELLVDQFINTTVSDDVVCAKELSRKKALRGHYTQAWATQWREGPTSLETQLITNCHGRNRWTESQVGGHPSASNYVVLSEKADRLAQKYGYTLSSSAAGEGAALAEVTCEREASGWDYDTAVADDISVGAPADAAISWNSFVYEEFCPSVE